MDVSLIWFTEFGWPIDDEQANAKDVVSQREQSDYLSYVLDGSMRSGCVQRVFWYVLRATTTSVIPQGSGASSTIPSELLTMLPN